MSDVSRKSVMKTQERHGREHKTRGSEIDVLAVNPISRGVKSVGRLVSFSLQVLRELPVVVRFYPSEVFRQSGRLILSNSIVVLFMAFMLGLLVALTVHFMFSSIGVESYIAGSKSIGEMRGTLEIVFGWIIAAKVGCGIVAEIGAMKIGEEIDAMEVMGVRSIPFLAGSRVLAGLIVFPFLWVAAVTVNIIAGYLMNVELLNTASGGAYIYFLFLFQNMSDFVYALIWATLNGVMVILVSCYYGFRARGGPVGVGRSTAMSMLVNLVLISVSAMMLVQLFYGNSPNAPIGN